MAESRNTSYAKPWEILAAYFGFFAVAKDIPDIFRMLRVPSLVPHMIKGWLLQVVPSSNFWILLFFAVTSLYVAKKLVWPSSEPKESAEHDSIKITTVEGKRRFSGSSQEVESAIVRWRRLQVLKTLGLSWVRGKILDFLGVVLYGTFLRQSHWPPAPLRWKSIDRISFGDGTGREYQYPKDLSSLICRSHPSGNDTYGPEEFRIPKGKEAFTLLVASNVFAFWLLLYFGKRLLFFWK